MDDKWLDEKGRLLKPVTNIDGEHLHCECGYNTFYYKEDRIHGKTIVCNNCGTTYKI